MYLSYLVSGLLLLIIVSGCGQKPVTEVDILITGGRVYTGEDTSSFIGHVGIKDDKIIFVGTDLSGVVASDTIRAEGYVVCPGFIDPHTHAGQDLRDSIGRVNINYLSQGVTTVFVGNDGGSYSDLESQFSLWETHGIGTNAASYVGHSTVRRQVMGMRDTLPTQAEIDQMSFFIRRAMDAGALGLSSGLYYAPASYSNTEEVIALARVAGEYGGVYDVHLRDESSYNIGLLGAIEETIRISEESGIPAHIAHIKCLGADVWGQSAQVIALIDDARQRGLKITADQYPYEASGTSVTGALMPRWALAGGDLTSKLAVPVLRDSIYKQISENLRRRGGPSTLLLTSPSEKNIHFKGKTLQDVSDEWQLDPIESAVRIIQNGGSSVASFNMQESDIHNFMRQPWVMTGSDGSTGHPRKYGSFSKKISDYVIQNEVISLGQMIYQSTGLPAQTFGLDRRGVLRGDHFADIIIFRPRDVVAYANFEDPTLLSEGMFMVFVNGAKAINNGSPTGTLSGRPLRFTAQEAK